MTPSDDLSPPRRPLFFPVVIATVFLTIMGMTAGFVLGERHRERMRTQAADQTSSPTLAPSPTPTGAFCPDETRKAAAALGLATDLRQLRRFETRGGTTVWICRDPAGGVYYQGKTGGVDRAFGPDNTLFLPGVRVLSDPEAYEVLAPDGNQIRVTAEQVEVQFADGRRTQIDKVTTHE